MIRAAVILDSQHRGAGVPAGVIRKPGQPRGWRTIPVAVFRMIIAAAILAGCQDGGTTTTTQSSDAPPPVAKTAPPHDTQKPAENPPAQTDTTPVKQPSPPTNTPADTASSFTLPPGYDEAEAGLQQNDKDLMAQAMAVLPPSNYDAQAIRLIVAAALGDAPTIKRESAQLDASTPTASPYSSALADLAKTVSTPKPDWNHLDQIADTLNQRKGCILAYDALALFAHKAGDSTRAARYKKMAADHAGQDG